MAELFGLTGRETAFFNMQAVACGDWDKFKMDEAQALESLRKFCEKLVFGEFVVETMVDAMYTVCQDALLREEKLPVELLAILPPFNLFGQVNLPGFLHAWEDGGAEALKEEFELGFAEGWEEDRTEYAALTHKLFVWRYASFQRYGSVGPANQMIDRLGLDACVELSNDDFLERLEIRKTRAGLTDEESVVLALTTIAAGRWETVGLDAVKALALIEDFLAGCPAGQSSEELTQSVFIPAQNALMAFRRDDFETIQREPPFSDFARENFKAFSEAFREGGPVTLSEVFEETFTDGWAEREPPPEIITILSGDGQTAATAIEFSTAERQKRIRMEFCYIYYTYGKDWTHLHTTGRHNDELLSRWSLDLPGGRQAEVFFKTS